MLYKREFIFKHIDPPEMRQWFRNAISKLILQNENMSISRDFALMWMPQNAFMPSGNKLSYIQHSDYLSIANMWLSYTLQEENT